MTLWSWGANNYGQLGLGAANEQHQLPQAVPRLPRGFRPRQLSGGGGHSLLLLEDGRLLGCGWNSRGQLGTGDRKNREGLTEIPLDLVDSSPRAVACGWDFSLLVSESGRVYACGSNTFGQLGLGEEIRGVDGFAPVTALTKKVASAAAGLRHSLLLAEDGTVWGCGTNKRGQLGLPDATNYFVPAPVPDLQAGDIGQVAAGQHHSLALTRAGDRVLSMYDDKALPKQEPNYRVSGALKVLDLGVDSKVVTVDSGWSHGGALTEDGLVVTWGRNDYGQLGKEGVSLAHLDLEATTLSVGSEHCLALRKSDGALLSWGWNEHGNCGDGTTVNVKSPKEVKNLDSGVDKIKLILAASGHNMAFR